VDRGWPFDQPGRASEHARTAAPFNGGYGTMRYTNCVSSSERSVSRGARAGAEVFEKPSGDEDTSSALQRARPPGYRGPRGVTGYHRFAPADAPCRIESELDRWRAPGASLLLASHRGIIRHTVASRSQRHTSARCDTSNIISPGDVTRQCIVYIASCRAECARVATLESGTRRRLRHTTT